LRERVAVATVEGKAYFLIVNELREHDMPFVSLVPGEAVPSQIKVVVTTTEERRLVSHENVLVLPSEGELDSLVHEISRILQGKKAYEKITVGIDPGVAIGLAVIADGTVIDQSNCFSTHELVNSVAKTLRNVDFSLTQVSIKIGNGVPSYREILEGLDAALPREVTLEVVSEYGTNKALKERHSRKVRHISSAIHIAARSGHIVPRGRTVEADNRIR
jgi:hypothetical protein